MKEIQGSQTENNILKTFAGESQARNRYDYFASKAKKDGYVKVSKVFEETAAQEKEHAKRMFKFLKGGMGSITAEFPLGIIKDTSTNLEMAADGEKEEWTDLYPTFAETADKEGYPEIAAAWRGIIVAEKYHEQRFRSLKRTIDEGKMFSREESTVWRCLNCGYLHEGTTAPQLCPACAHPQGYFEVLGEDFLED